MAATVVAAIALLPAPASAQVPAEGAATAPQEASTKRAVSKGELRRGLNRRMRSVGGNSGAYVTSVDGPDGSLYSRNGGARRILASNTKLFTTAATIGRFGADGRRETGVYARGQRMGPGDRVLEGSLVVVGDGDPALASKGFANRNNLPLTELSELVRAVKSAGIEVVRGRVRADDTIFDRNRRAGPYLSPLSGLSYNSGYRPGGGYASDPEIVAVRKLRGRLRKAGVRVTKGVGRADLPRSVLDTPPLGEARSPSIESLISETNKPSNNFFAEMLLKRLGARPGRRGTTRRGANKAENFAKSIGVRARLRDGSGLSRGNKAEPREVAQLLKKMAAQPGAKAFRTSLPLAGREGTVAGRMRGTAAEGNCRTKTGTLSGVSALSGYCDAGPETLAFSILMNGVDVVRARNAQDGMASLIARFRR